MNGKVSYYLLKIDKMLAVEKKIKCAITKEHGYVLWFFSSGLAMNIFRNCITFINAMCCPRAFSF